VTDVREIERRIQQSAERVDSHVRLPGRPAGIPEDVEVHIKLMYDLLALAWQTEITRTSTFMLAKELSNAVYPKSGIRDSFHILSHHSNNESNKARFAVLNRYHATLFAYFLHKLAKLPDGEGTLLDHSLVLYGSGMSDGNSTTMIPCRSFWPGALAARFRATGTFDRRSSRRCRICYWRSWRSSDARKSISAIARHPLRFSLP
jgi:hypothetical protein